MREHDGGVPRVDSGVRRLSFHLNDFPFREYFPADEVPVDFHDSRIRFQGSVNVLFGPYRTRRMRAGAFVHVALFFDRPFENQIFSGNSGVYPAMVDDFFTYADGVGFRVDVHVAVHGGDDEFATSFVDDFGSRSGRRRKIEILGYRRLDDDSSDVHSGFAEFAGDFFQKFLLGFDLRKEIRELRKVDPSVRMDFRGFVLAEFLRGLYGRGVGSFYRVRLRGHGHASGLLGFRIDSGANFLFAKPVPDAVFPEVRDELVEIQFRLLLFDSDDFGTARVETRNRLVDEHGFEKILGVRKSRGNLHGPVQGPAFVGNADDVRREAEFGGNAFGFEFLLDFERLVRMVHDLAERGIVQFEEVRARRERAVGELIERSRVFFENREVEIVSVGFLGYETWKEDFPLLEIRHVSKYSPALGDDVAGLGLDSFRSALRHGHRMRRNCPGHLFGRRGRYVTYRGG